MSPIYDLKLVTINVQRQKEAIDAIVGGGNVLLPKMVNSVPMI